MNRKGLAYGWLAARRRLREMVLPVVTTATGSFLVVLVFGMSADSRAVSDTRARRGDQPGGDPDRGHRAARREWSKSRWPPPAPWRTVPVNSACSEPTAYPAAPSSRLSSSNRWWLLCWASLLGAVCAGVTGVVVALLGLAPTGVSYAGLVVGAAIAVGVSVAAAVATSFVPTFNAASRPPIRSLTAGG